MICKKCCRYAQFNDQTVQFLTIQFSMSQSEMVPTVAMYNLQFN